MMLTRHRKYYFVPELNIDPVLFPFCETELTEFFKGFEEEEILQKVNWLNLESSVSVNGEHTPFQFRLFNIYQMFVLQLAMVPPSPLCYKGKKETTIDQICFCADVFFDHVESDRPYGLLPISELEDDLSTWIGQLDDERHIPSYVAKLSEEIFLSYLSFLTRLDRFLTTRTCINVRKFKSDPSTLRPANA